MRILVVHSIYHPYKKGGAEVVVEKFVDEMKKTHEVTVLTTSRTGGYVESDEDGVRVVRFSPFNIFSIHDIDHKPLWQRVIWHALDVWNVHSWFVMKRVLKKYQPDVVWTHTMKGVGYLAMKVIQKEKEKRKKEKALRWILTPHNEEYVYQFGYGLAPFNIGLIEKITIFFTRWLTKGPDLIFSPSKQIQDFYRGLGFWKGIQGSWDWPVFQESHNMEHGAWSMEHKKKQLFTFGFLGQLEEHKGVRLLVEAFKSYSGQNVRLLVAGRGMLSEYVRQQSKEDPRIEFFGEYRTGQLDELFENMNVLMVPSTIRDNMPTVILESFAHGVPVIGSNLGGIPEALSNGKGLLLHGLKESDFHSAFEEVRRPKVYSRLVQSVAEWKPLGVGESLTKIGL